jgi:hypothetical protein
MRRGLITLGLVVFALHLGACSTYKATPLPFKAPAAYPNVTRVDGAEIAAKAYADPEEARGAFGFDIRGAGMLPVQVVFDNQGGHFLKINGGQTFLEDDQGNLWPILEKKIAYDRASRHAGTRHMLGEAGSKGLLGAGAGAIIGGAIGIVTGTHVGSAAGKGAAAGGALGAVGGGAAAYGSGEARGEIVSDLRRKSLENKAVEPGGLANGFLFFPGEASSPRQLRLQLVQEDTGKVINLLFSFYPGR